MPLGKMCLTCEVTKKVAREEMSAPLKDVVYMEGARWHTVNGTIAESRLQELYPPMPIMIIKAITQDKQETLYECRFDEDDLLRVSVAALYQYLFLQHKINIFS